MLRRLLYIICMLQSFSVAAQQRDTMQVRTLKEVTVQYKALLNRSNTPVQVMKGAMLETMNSLSVADAVRYFSGVQLKDYGGIGGLKTVDTRSMGSNHTAVFYDGIQLGNAQNGQVDLGKFSLDNIDEIALYNAQKSDIFQSARSFAAAAAIYLQPKVPVFTNDARFHTKATVRTGSFGLFNPSLLYEQQISQKVSASISSEWIHANGQYTFRYTNGTYDTSATRTNADIDALRTEAGLYGRLADSARWDLRLYHYSSERGLPGAVVANKFSRGQRQWDRNFFVQGSFTGRPGKRFSYKLQGKYANDYMRYLDPEFVTTQGYLDNRYHQQELYLSSVNSFQLKPWWKIAAAADLQWNKLNANLYHFAYPTRYTALVSLASQWEWKRVNVQGGALQTLVWDRVRQFERAGDRQELTPFLSVSWQPFNADNFRLRGFYKHIFRLPTFNDLYYTFIGNTNLRPEFARQYDAGFTWVKHISETVPQISIQADAYYNEITDKIVAVPTTNLYRWMMLNLGKVAVRSIDAVVASTLKPGAQLLLNGTLKYTWQHAQDMTPGAANYQQQIPYVPVNSGSVVMNILWKQLGFNYSFIYSGERYSQKMNIPENYLQPWYTHDISLSGNFMRKRTGIRISLEVNNLLNQHYDVIVNFPMPGRYYRVACSITYN